jgi:hypothetical protein
MVHSMVLSFSHHSAFPIHGFNTKSVVLEFTSTSNVGKGGNCCQPFGSLELRNRATIIVSAATPTVLQDSAAKMVDVQGLLVHA